MRAVRALALVSVVALIALGAGCGGDDDNDNNASTTETNTTQTTTTETNAAGGGASGGGKTVTVAMDEYSFDPSDVSISKGGTLVAENKGKISHNLTIEKGPDPKQQTQRLEATSTFLPGKDEELKVELSPGKYAMVCTVPGHRELGMTGTITVK